MHRERAAIKRKTVFKKALIKTDWYKKKPQSRSLKRPSRQSASLKPGCQNITLSAPIFIPRTPGGTLAQKIRKVEEGYNKVSKRRVKLVEEGGSTIKQLLFHPDTWEMRDCHRENCPGCKHPGGGGELLQEICELQKCLYTM